MQASELILIELGLPCSSKDQNYSFVNIKVVAVFHMAMVKKYVRVKW